MPWGNRRQDSLSSRLTGTIWRTRKWEGTGCCKTPPPSTPTASGPRTTPSPKAAPTRTIISTTTQPLRCPISSPPRPLSLSVASPCRPHCHQRATSTTLSNNTISTNGTAAWAVACSIMALQRIGVQTQKTQSIKDKPTVGTALNAGKCIGWPIWTIHGNCRTNTTTWTTSPRAASSMP